MAWQRDEVNGKLKNAHNNIMPWTVRAPAFLSGNECGVSHGKIRRHLSELTDDEIEISDGMVNGLCAEFSAKTGKEKQKSSKS